MPSNVFNELKSEKKQKIIDVGIYEFAMYGYQNSSTNRMVKDAGISKGSLFKYFANKEEFYFYLLDYVTQELIVSMQEKKESLPKELVARVIQYAKLEFTWYFQNPIKYKMILNALMNKDAEVYQKIEKRYQLKGQDIYYDLLDDVDLSQLKFDKKKVSDILKWVLQGFNDEFMSNKIVNGELKLGKIMDDYVNQLTEYLEVLTKGFLI